MKAIMERRSIRKYKSDPVPEESVKALLEAAMAAPSAGNGQPWHFVVVDDRDKLNTITGFHLYSQMLKEAPMAIIVCGDVTNERYQGFWVQDCAAATENILIKATDIGLGTVWLGLYPNESHLENMKKLLELPEGIVPMSMIAVGHPAEEKPPADRYNEERVHWNRWSR
jgi:nitroreductase